MLKYGRYVLDNNAEGKSYIKLSNETVVKEDPGTFWRTDIWATQEVPVDLDIDEDRALKSVTREPAPGGMTFRLIELWPDKTGEAREEHRRKLEKFHREAKQKHMPTEEDYARHPGMHLVDFLVVTFVVRGEAYLMTDTDEILLRQGDSAVIPGVKFAWSNRSSEPVLLASTLVDALPRKRGPNDQP